MKLFKYIISATSIVLAIASCGKSDIPEYQWGPKDTDGAKTEVYFTAANEAAVEMTSEDKTYTVQLGRSVTTGALTVPIKVVFNQGGAFKVPESVSFADGDATADLEIDISNVPAATETSLEIAIPEDYYYLYKNYSTAGVSHNCAFSITKVTWETIAKGTYSSVLVGDCTNVELQNCKEVPTRFRFKNPFGTGCNIEFKLSGKPSDTPTYDTYVDVTGPCYNLTVDPQGIGMTHPSYPQFGEIIIVDVATQQAKTSYLKYNMYFPETHYFQGYVRYGWIGVGFVATDDDVFVAD